MVPRPQYLSRASGFIGTAQTHPEWHFAWTSPMRSTRFTAQLSSWTRPRSLPFVPPRSLERICQNCWALISVRPNGVRISFAPKSQGSSSAGCNRLFPGRSVFFFLPSGPALGGPSSFILVARCSLICNRLASAPRIETLERQ